MLAMENVIRRSGIVNKITKTSRISPHDEDLREKVMESIWKEQSIRVLDFNDIQVEAVNGEVTLYGHVSKSLNKYLAEECARKVDGVKSFRNEIIIDEDLRVMVARALGNDQRTRPYVINVGCQHGWINLTGVVPDNEVCTAVEEIAGSVPYVRGVIGLPRVAGEDTGKLMRRMQPEIGSEIIDKDGITGVVSKVIINPRNKLVSHIIIEKNEIIQGTRISREYIVPIDDVDSVRAGSTWLKQNLSLDRLHPADPRQFSAPAKDWRAPFPYKLDQVLWWKEVHPSIHD